MEGLPLLLAIMVTHRMAGAKGWVIHQKMTDLDHVHYCSSPFMCLIKSWLVQNKWNCNPLLELSGEQQEFCREAGYRPENLHYHLALFFHSRVSLNATPDLMGKKAWVQETLLLKWWYRRSGSRISSSFYQLRKTSKELWPGQALITLWKTPEGMHL